MNNIGAKGENLACEYLKGLGYDIIERNYHSKYGEIDIIAHIKGKESFVFVEVKTRSGRNEIKPCEYVDERKRRKIVKTALVYLCDKVYSVSMRFDVIDIIFENGVPLIKHYENAFTGEYI